MSNQDIYHACRMNLGVYPTPVHYEFDADRVFEYARDMPMENIEIMYHIDAHLLFLSEIPKRLLNLPVITPCALRKSTARLYKYAAKAKRAFEVKWKKCTYIDKDICEYFIFNSRSDLPDYTTKEMKQYKDFWLTSFVTNLTYVDKLYPREVSKDYMDIAYPVIFKHVKTDKKDVLECPICYSTESEIDFYTTYSCMHSLCKECICTLMKQETEDEELYKEEVRCPLCRATIIDAEYMEDSLYEDID